jgi:hypothetical protein
MFGKQIASVMAASLLASGLFAQGLQTNATKDDWEEINFEFNSSILSDGYPTLLRLSELLQQHRDYRIKGSGSYRLYVGSLATNEGWLARGNTVKAPPKYGVSATQIHSQRAGQTDAGSAEHDEGRGALYQPPRRADGGSPTPTEDYAAGSGGSGQHFDDRLKKLEDCCNAILRAGQAR